MGVFLAHLSDMITAFGQEVVDLARKDVICISEVIDISPGNLDSSLCFFQPSVSHDVLCISVK